MFDRIVRAVYFPPYKSAYIKDGTKKIYQIPPHRKQHNTNTISPINSHKF